MAENKSGWQVTGRGPSAWESFMVPAIADSLGESLVERVGLRPGQRVLDVACGTGCVARKAVGRVRWGGEVKGLDLNAGQLEVARAAASFVYPEIEYVEGDAQKMPFPDASFDAVLCLNGLQYFPDRVAALREMRRVRAPGGRVAFLVMRHIQDHPVWVHLADALNRHVGSGCGDMMQGPFQLHDGELIRSLVREAGFAEAKREICVRPARFPSVREFVRFQTSALPRPNPAVDPTSAIDSIADELGAKLGQFQDDYGFMFPCHAWVVDAQG
jgi:ubiquinone/menaquinone biosynthesis C-methylase UbiE